MTVAALVFSLIGPAAGTIGVLTVIYAFGNAFRDPGLSSIVLAVLALAFGLVMGSLTLRFWTLALAAFVNRR